MPQEGILSPTLFNIVVLALPAVYPSMSIHVLRRSVRLVLSYGQTAPDKAPPGSHQQNHRLPRRTWNDLITGEDNVHAIYRRHFAKYPIYVKGQPIQTVSSHKFLGVHLDNQLAWHQEIEDIRRRSNLVLSAMRAASEFTWGPSKEILR